MFEYQEYDNYEQKIEKLEQIFGQWPPPFDPFYAVQISQGRCGSNALYGIVKSFFQGGTDATHFEEMDDPQFSDINFIPNLEKKYFYYNVHDVRPHRLHFPFMFWILRNSPKVVYLVRQDHLMRAISIFYANMEASLYPHGQRFKHFDEVCQNPVDMVKLDRLIRNSVDTIERVKRLISKFVSEDRLLLISYYDLYHANTLKTVSQLMHFLEPEPRQTRFAINMDRHTQHELIPNLKEVSDRYDREVSEQPYWVPKDLNIDEINTEIDKWFEEMVRLNVR